MPLKIPARSIRFAMIALFAAGGLLVWGELAPVDGLVSFRVPPSVKTTTGSLRRAEIRNLRVVVRDAEGEVVAQSEQSLIEPMRSPVTPPLFMRLPRASYALLVTLVTEDGRAATMAGTLELSADGYHRVDLKHPM